MGLPRQTVTPAQADLGFSLEMPIGFCDRTPAPAPSAGGRFELVTLLRSVSPMVLSWLSVHGRSRVEAPSVRDWLVGWAAEHDIALSTCAAVRVGGVLQWHPALLARGTQTRRRTRVDLCLIAVEDGGRLLLAEALSEEAATSDYLPTLEHCIGTLQWNDARGPTLPLHPGEPTPAMERLEHDPELPMPKDANEIWHRMMAKKRDAAVAQALPLVAQDRFDEAEQLVKAADNSIYTAVALGRMYSQALQQAKDDLPRGDARIVALFQRALHWKQAAYPDPHTAIEAEDYEAGRRADLAGLIDILGYDPR